MGEPPDVFARSPPPWPSLISDNIELAKIGWEQPYGVRKNKNGVRTELQWYLMREKGQSQFWREIFSQPQFLPLPDYRPPGVFMPLHLIKND